MSDDESLFNAASLIYSNSKESAVLPSFGKSHIGNARITLRSPGGEFLAHIPRQQAKDALTSGRFGSLEGDLPSLIKLRAEVKAKERERRDQYLLALTAKVRSWLFIAKRESSIAEPTENRGQNTLIKFGAIALGGVAVVWAFNFISLQVPLNSVISTDPRNSGVKVGASYQWMINPGVMVFSVNEASSASPADVTRILFQYAERLETRNFTSVLLARKGKPVFRLKGDYFKQLGEEFGTQNVIYTLRTMPENVYELDGSSAFASWSGGWLGVISKQLEDLNSFHRRWLVEGP